MLKSIVVFVGCWLIAAVALAESIGMGEAFPEIQLPVPVEAGARAYLGLQSRETFTVQQVKARVVLVEMLNVLCPHCRKQTKPYNQLFQMLEADPVTRGKVKMLGVAVANSDEQIADFVDIYQVAFPIVADRQFALHGAIRGGPTPFSIYLLQDPQGGPGVVAGTHLGEDRQMDELFAYLKELLAMQVADFAGLADDRSAAAEAGPALPISRDELERRIRQRLGTNFGRVESLDYHDLTGGGVYLARVHEGGLPQTLFVRVVSRSAICDICHDVHFYYLFDRSGRLLDLVPLHLTKYGNVEWTEKEVGQFKSRIVGKNLNSAWEYKPEVDAVSSATMTSAIIYNSLATDRRLLEQLAPAGE